MRLKLLTAGIILLLCLNASVLSAGPINKVAPAGNSAIDSSKKDTTGLNSGNGITNQGNLGIDTSAGIKKPEPVITADTAGKRDSSIVIPDEKTMTNTKLFIYILLSALGLGLFFFIFVINLFKTFHKNKSTRQSLMMSWSLFFIVSIIWIFIVWGLLAGFWTSASFMVVVIFLFIISLTMTIIAVKSR